MPVCLLNPMPASPANASLLSTSVVDDYGLETVQEYMYHIRANAEMSVRSLLKDVAKRAGTNILSAVDYLDDGSPVSNKLTCATENPLLSGISSSLSLLDPTQRRDQ
jgi:N-methylhydantoinase B/oxoprolinase/acetone carboxylase alpha subunit